MLRKHAGKSLSRHTLLRARPPARHADVECARVLCAGAHDERATGHAEHEAQVREVRGCMLYFVCCMLHVASSNRRTSGTTRSVSIRTDGLYCASVLLIHPARDLPPTLTLLTVLPSHPIPYPYPYPYPYPSPSNGRGKKRSRGEHVDRSKATPAAPRQKY